jgi:hypothetical protein
VINKLEKIDMLRARVGISYKEAKEALEKAEEDVIQALIDLEEKNRKFNERIQDSAQELVEQIKEFYEKGKEVRLKLKRGGETLFEVPAVWGAAGVLGIMASRKLVLLATIGAAMAVARHYSLEIDRPGPQNN